MSSSKIQEYNLDPNCGFAKEESVQQILSAVGSGVTANVVKSVQHGFVAAGTARPGCESNSLTTSDAYQYYVDVPISTVSNIDKCQVKIDTYAGYSGNLYIGRLIDNDTLRVYCDTGANQYTGGKVSLGFTWEVTEFY